jgi:hypothetical protein
MGGRTHKPEPTRSVSAYLVGRPREWSPADVGHVALISPGYLPDCRPRTVGSHTSNLCIIISKEGFCTYIVTFISNLNPTLLRYFSLLSTSSVFSAASLSSVPLCYICSGVTKCLPWHSLSFSSFSQNFTNSR